MLARGQQSLIYRSDVRIFLFVMLSATSAFITGCAFQRSLNSTTCSVGLSSSHATETTAHWAQKYGPADPVLSELLKRIAINGDVIAAVSNHALMSPVRSNHEQALLPVLRLHSSILTRPTRPCRTGNRECYELGSTVYGYAPPLAKLPLDTLDKLKDGLTMTTNRPQMVPLGSTPLVSTPLVCSASLLP